MLVKFTMIRPDKFADLVRFVESDDNCIKTNVAVRENESDGKGPTVIKEREVTFVELVNYRKTAGLYREYFIDVDLKMEEGVAYAVKVSGDKIEHYYIPVPIELYMRVLTLLGLDPEALGDNRPLVNKHGQQIDSDDALRLWRAMHQKFGKKRI